jgi:prepilin-type N-terminal cleavage/methylation domain-containing protein
MSRRNQRGFTLIEALAGILILGLVVVTSLLIFFERQKRLRSANERILVWQVLANEAEVERRVPFVVFDDKKTWAFKSDIKIIWDGTPTSPLDGVVTQVTSKDVKFVNKQPTVKHVTLDVGWNDQKVRRHAKLTLVRVDTGGPPLW